jgi:two-component system, LytTR family, response regulator
MKKITCMVVDDEQHAIDLLSDHIKQTPELRLIHVTTSPFSAIELINKGGIDLVFLDVKMPDLNGIDVIRAITGKTKVILCTAYRRYALAGFEHDVVDYLLKPVMYERFIKGLAKARTLIEAERKAQKIDFLPIRGQTRNSRIKIHFDDIDLLEAKQNYTAVYVQGKKHLTSMRLKKLLEYLPSDDFIRVHHSFIIPVKRITQISNTELRLKNIELPIPIGPAYKKNLAGVMKSYQ